MKLQTSIKPRRDGVVIAKGVNGQSFVFTTDPMGELSCDVTDEQTVVMLLATGNFWPEDQSDLDAALAMVNKPEDEQTGDDPDDEDEDEMALPLEAGTPPAPKSLRKAKHKAR